MPFSPGDRVHVAGLGTGIVREARGNGRFAIEIKGRIVVAAEGAVESANPPPRKHQRSAALIKPEPESRGDIATVDLHGKTVDDAVAIVEAFINDALLAGRAQAHVIHGRSGGRVKAAVHQYLRKLSGASFRVDPRNPGVTIITFV